MQQGPPMERDLTADTQRTGQSETGRQLINLTVFGATGGIGGHVVRQGVARTYAARLDDHQNS